MIRLPDRSLSARATSWLSRWQAAVDATPSYADRVAEADRGFHQRNRGQNKTFAEVKETLAKMCSGARRCAYCEDSYADEAEHIRPKSLYPEACYEWMNYLYACGPCNGPKNNRFAILIGSNLLEVTRARNAPIVPPPTGPHALINPRVEDPLSFLEIDLADTFFVLPSRDPGTVEFVRAEHTIDVLRLNERDALPKARAEAYGSYRARLCEYVEWTQQGRSTSELVGAIRRMAHPMVWAEMRRQHPHRPDLVPLFQAAPEALSW